MSETERYLDAVDDHLPLVDVARLEVIDELADHIDESSLALESEGMEPYAAELEAIRRMGDPERLARDLGKARESRRRLVPAAGYVAVGVVRTWLGGYLTGLLVLVAVAVLTATVLSGAGIRMPSGSDMFRSAGFVANTILTGFVAYLIGRATPYRLALSAHRSLEWSQRVTALVGAGALLAIALLDDRTAPDAWSIGGALAAPLLLVLGVRASTDPPGPLVRWRDLAGLAIATIIVVIAAGLLRPAWLVSEASTTDTEASGAQVVPGTDRDAPMDAGGPLLWAHLRLPVGHQALFEVIESEPGRTGLTDRRLEIWAATPDGARIDPAATVPLFSLPVPGRPDHDAGTRDTEVSLDTHLMREWPPTWSVLTATDSDGSRVVLDLRPNGTDLAYRGTALDWLLGR